MGIGPNGTSLLEKLGFKRAHLMNEDELLTLVKKEQARRSVARAIGRIIRADKGKKPDKIQTLEDVGLAPATCNKLRQSGLSDLAIIQRMQQKGLL